MKQHQTPVYYVPKKKFKTPIQEALGHHEAWVYRLSGGKTLKYVDDILQCFLKEFPRYKYVQQFTSVDVADYIVIRERAGVHPRGLARELMTIRRWWKWMIEDVGLPLRDIIRAHRHKFRWDGKSTNALRDSRVKNKNSLSLEGVKRLLEEAESLQLKVFIVDTLAGKKFRVAHDWKLYPEWRRAAERAGLPSGLSPRIYKVKVADRLTNDVVQAYCADLRNQIIESYGQEARDALAVKPKLPRHSLRAIEVSPPDERPSVPNSYEDLTPGLGIIE